MSQDLPYHVSVLGLALGLFASPANAQAPAAGPLNSSPPGNPPAVTVAADPPPGAPPAPPAPPAEQPPPAPPSAGPPPPLAPTPLGRPLIDVHVEAPPPPEQRKFHMHDGFYLRLSAGPTYGTTHVSSNRPNHPSYNAYGPGLGFDAMIGGSPSVGLALGGMLSLRGYGHGEASAGGGMLGAFVDGFPEANGGFHLGGMLGLATSSTSRSSNTDELRGGGVGMAAWLGYDWWVADEWSMGTLLNFGGSVASDRSEDEGPDAFKLTGSSFHASLMFSVLYH